MYNVFIKKTREEKNCQINFVECLKGFQTEIYFNRKKNGYTHRKMVYSNRKIENLKRNSQRLFKITDDDYKFIIIVEEDGFKVPKYTAFIEYSTNMDLVLMGTNHVITQPLLDRINKVIQEENELNARYNEYETLPEGVRNCVPFEDIDFLEEAIANHTWYSRQVYRLDCLSFVLGSKNVKRWLSNLGISSVSKVQKDLDSLAIYVAKRLTKGLPNTEKEIFVKKISRLERKYA